MVEQEKDKTKAVSLDIKLVVGLGNPGVGYALNRHNVGFLVVDFLQQEWGYPSFQLKGKVALSRKNQEQAMLAKPLTFMNLSGASLPGIMQLYKLSCENILVIHDETEIEFGDIRLKIGGGAGGHNGLKSIDQTIGKEYWRLRIGVGRALDRDLSAHVLGNFTSDEQNLLSDLLTSLSDALPDLLTATKPHDWLSKFKNGL